MTILLKGLSVIAAGVWALAAQAQVVLRTNSPLYPAGRRLESPRIALRLHEYVQVLTGGRTRLFCGPGSFRVDHASAPCGRRLPDIFVRAASGGEPWSYPQGWWVLNPSLVGGHFCFSDPDRVGVHYSFPPGAMVEFELTYLNRHGPVQWQNFWWPQQMIDGQRGIADARGWLIRAPVADGGHPLPLTPRDGEHIIVRWAEVRAETIFRRIDASEDPERLVETLFAGDCAKQALYFADTLPMPPDWTDGDGVH